MNDKLVNKLIKMGYKEKNAQSLGERLTASEPIRGALNKWVNEDAETNCGYDGISVLGLMDERGFTYPAALSMIAWLHRDPIAAKKSLSSRIDAIIGEES